MGHCSSTACGASDGEANLEIVAPRPNTMSQECGEIGVVSEVLAPPKFVDDASHKVKQEEDSSEISTAASSNTNQASVESPDVAMCKTSPASAPAELEASVAQVLAEGPRPSQRPGMALAIDSIRSRTLSASQRCASQRSESQLTACSARPSAQSSAIISECAGLPPPRAPEGLKPITSGHLPGTTISAIREALEAEDGPVQKFMREVLGCSDFSTTPWAASRRNLGDAGRQGLFFRKSRYRALLPADIPGPVARLVGAPPSLDAHSLFALGCSESELVLVQQSFVKGIMYSDRFRLQNTFSFTQVKDGCTLAQWAEVVWTKPLPWTHTPVKVFVEKKARAEAKGTFRDFARTIQEAAC